MQEPGINAISAWLLKNKRKAIMLVPQCPQDKSWLGTMQDALVHLLRTYTDRGVADAGKVYILGGSMGGTGTWNMLSHHHHPELFAAAMPVAGRTPRLGVPTHPGIVDGHQRPCLRRMRNRQCHLVLSRRTATAIRTRAERGLYQKILLCRWQHDSKEMLHLLGK